MSKDTKNSSADLSRYRWVELFDFVLSERDGFETDTHVYLQIMFGMFNGAIVDEIVPRCRLLTAALAFYAALL